MQVIDYQGSPDVFAWKYSSNELTSETELLVRETQEAILFKSGIACDVFQAGRHALNAENTPLLNQLFSTPRAPQSPFVAEIWFVNKTFLLEVKWGTATPIQLQDPKYKAFVPVRAFGQFGVQISNSKKFLLKLAGTLPQFDKATLLQYFRGLCLSKIMDVISSYLARKNVGVLEINAYLDEISVYLQEKLAPFFDEFGIKLTAFCVNNINVPEDDPAVVRLKEALAKRAEMEIVGYGYQQERSFDLLERAVNNPNSLPTGLTNAALGLGLNVEVGRQVGNLSRNLSLAGNEKQCPACRSAVNVDAKFCSYCGFDFSQKKKNAAQVQCSACGATFAPTAKFCPKCGKRYIPCAKCGADAPNDATVCPVCGARAPRPCPRCQTPLNESYKFCPECGYAFVVKCANCGKELAENVKFCPECGAAPQKEDDQ